MPRCPQCGAFGRLTDEKCEKCGSPFPKRASVEERLAAIDSRLNERLAKIDRVVGGTSQAAPALAKPPVVARAHEEPEGEEMALSPETEQFVFSGAHEPRQAHGVVLECTYLHSNRPYADRARATTMHVDIADFEVNAYATDREVLTSEAETLKPPVVVILRGLIQGVTVASAGLALGLLGGDHTLTREVFQALGEQIRAGRGQLGVRRALAIYGRFIGPALEELPDGGPEQVMAVAQSVRLSAYLYVLSHELGHIALAHTLGRSPNLESSRNREREADSFASSVLSTCPYREYHFLGQMAAISMFVWSHEACGSPDATTHPDARERFANAFVTNSHAAAEAAQRFGLSQEDFATWLPQ